MKIHFIMAPPIKSPKLGELSEGRIPPLGILYLASYLRENVNNLQLKVTDGIMEGFEKTISEVKKFQPDIVGISYYTLCALGAYKLIDEIKKEDPNTFVIAGGPHATALPKEALEKSDVDAIVIGEGEATVHELVSLFARGKHKEISFLEKVAGIAYKDNGQVRLTSTRQHIKDLDSIPIPARDLINMGDYKGWYVSKERKEAAIFSTRGCPYSCTFCSNIVWRKAKPYIRVRSPRKVVDEIEELIRQYGIREVYDCCDEFNINTKFALAVCEEIKRRRLDIQWKVAVRATPLSEELVRAMAEAGCWYVLMGIESGNKNALKGINKHITLEEVETACRLFKKHNIKVQGLFMLYNVWEEDGELRYEDTEMVKKTFKYASELFNKGLLDYIGWSITVPYPGSKLYEIATKFNLIKPEYIGNWDYWLSKDGYVMQLPGITNATQIRMKTIGSILRAKMLVRNRDFKMKDMSWLVGKASKIVINELKAILG